MESAAAVLHKYPELCLFLSIVLGCLALTMLSLHSRRWRQ